MAAVVTLVSTVLVFSSQMQKRVQKLCLFRSIGSTRRQAGKLILWESIYIMIPAAAIGFLVGALMGMGILLYLFYGDSSLVHMEFPFVMLVNALAIWMLCVYLGMFWPI